MMRRCRSSRCSSNGNFVLELDFEPFSASFPRPTLSKSIGNGVEFLNRHLSAKLFHDKESMHPLLEFLKVHCYKGKVRFWTYSVSLICISSYMAGIKINDFLILVILRWELEFSIANNLHFSNLDLKITWSTLLKLIWRTMCCKF